jgi:hypothetical protein
MEKQEEVIEAVDPQTETLAELSKEEQFEQWVQLAAVDIFGKAVYFDKTVNSLLNEIATTVIKASKVKE